MAGGRKSKPPAIPAPKQTLVLDNGAYTIKAGFVAPTANEQTDAETASDTAPRLIPNCIARDRLRKTYVASELDRCKDFADIAFRRPVERGYIVNWEAQREIWDREFFDDKAPQKCNPSETRLVLTEQPNSLPALQTNCDQMVFEEFQFASCYRGIGPSFNAYLAIEPDGFRTETTPDAIARLPAEIILLVDVGYSMTTVTPIFRGHPLQSAIRRLDVGGKLLTNYLTRLLSLRHYDMRNDTYIVNEIREKACYLSLDFAGDLEKTWKGTRGERRADYLSGAGIAKDYVLPDFHARSQGVVRDYDPATSSRAKKVAASASNEDILTLRNERFAVPEILFHPSDIGLRQPGIADLIMESLAALPVGLWPALLSNVVAVGGTTQTPGFIQRLQRELVPLVPDECTVRVYRPSDPVATTWKGAANFARHADVERVAVTKQEYEEHGQGWVARKFAAGLGAE